MSWKRLHFGPGESISPAAIVELVSSGTDHALAICSRGAAAGESSQEDILAALQRMMAHKGLTAFLLDGEARGWLIGLAATSDLVIATPESKFILDGIDEEVAGFAAARLAQLVGKAHAMQMLIEGGVDVVTLQQWGLVTRLAASDELERWQTLLEELLPDGAFGAAQRLKKVWTTQQGAEIGDALTAERVEFQRCFEEGAAEEIAVYLQNLKNN